MLKGIAHPKLKNAFAFATQIVVNIGSAAGTLGVLVLRGLQHPLLARAVAAKRH